MGLSTDELIGNLKSLGDQVAGGGHGHPSPKELAAAFGWNGDRVRERRITIGETVLDVGRGFLGVQPAALFASPIHRNGADPLSGAALYGYHAAVRWGLFADERGLTAFNSHWLAQDDWFAMPTVPWDRLDAEHKFLSAFGPEQVAEGEPDRFALERYPNPKLLQPVDDELVDRLDAWRDEALKSSRTHSGVDEHLQTLFAKLFVLRTIEDRGLAPNVKPLSEAISTQAPLDVEALVSTFQEAREYIGSELFDNVQLDVIPKHVISGIIGDLYKPRRLPFAGSRYNFAWIDSDVLGLAYEKYLSTILHPLPPAPQMDLFQPSFRDVARISVRRAGGVYYTPEYLTKYLAMKCIDQHVTPDFLAQFLAQRADGGHSEGEEAALALPKVVDFACGSGSFLVAAVDCMLRRLKEHDPETNWGKLLIDGGHISGVDIDEKAVTVARLNIWNRLTEEPDPLPLPKLSKVIVKGDGLDHSAWKQLGQRFDIVLGNPPFLATSRVTNRDGLENSFETAKGRYDYSSLFVEQAIKVTEPEGTIGMVVPNRMFINHNAASIRSYLTERMNIDVIVDFGSNEVFQNTSAYVGCIVAKHQPIMSTPAPAVKVIDVKALPEQFVAALLLEAEAAGTVNKRDIRVYTAQHPRGGGPWTLLSMQEKMEQVRLSDASERLDNIAGIFQGIRTGANDIFILKIVAEDDRYGAELLNGLGDSAVLEAGLLEPVVFGAEVRKFEAVSYSKYLLYPYEGGSAISEGELELRYPQAFKYLHSYRDILSSRASIASSGLKWYELVRRRDEEWLRRPKLLIRDLAPEISFAVDADGEVFIVGGTAVAPEQEELLFPLLAYLNSSHVNALVKRTTPQFRGSFQKFEPQHLQSIPVLRRLIEDEAFQRQLDELARLAVTSSGEAKSTAVGDIDRVVEAAMREANIVAAE
ncbi:N-6 DNA methylase [Qipengyuania sp. GPGPB31]|uniref:Eco57I restriction-modification methylase domain-containing protein n=1 Tax=Qipengyuania sp. GPGPB31 TaxID=3023518 RepID=UPI00313423BB